MVKTKQSIPYEPDAEQDVDETYSLSAMHATH